MEERLVFYAEGEAFWRFFEGWWVGGLVLYDRKRGRVNRPRYRDSKANFNIGGCMTGGR